MHPTRILFYLFFTLIEVVAVAAAIFGVLFFFLPFVAVKTLYVVLSSRREHAKDPSIPS